MDAYRYLNCRRENIEKMDPKEADELIKRNYEEIIKKLNDKLEQYKDNFKKMFKIESDKRIFEEQYNKIKNEEARQKYNKELDEQERKRQREIKKEEIGAIEQYSDNNYDMSKKYNKDLLKIKPIRANVDGREYVFKDDNDNDLYIKKIGELVYQSGVITKSLGEYNVKKKIDGELKAFTVYSNISIIELSVDFNGKPRINPEYYDIVMRKLLSEKSLKENLRYNYGYLGEIRKNVNNDYCIDYIEDEVSAVYAYNSEPELERRNDDR